MGSQEMRDLLATHGDAMDSSNYTPGNYRDYLKTLALIQIAEELQGLNNQTKQITKTLNKLLGVDSGEAVSVQLIPGGITMSTTAPNTGTLTVDTVNGTVTIQYTDDKGDTNAAAPADASPSFVSDNPSVLTVSADATNPLQGDLVPVAEGVANVSASGLGTAPDGTSFSASPIAITVTAGTATGADFVLSVPTA
jgi:hypothetical protein